MADVTREVTARGEGKLIVTDPEYTISVIGLVASFCGQPIVGLILSILAMNQSKRGGRHNTYALVGFIISLVWLGLTALFLVGYFAIILLTVIISVTNGGLQ